MFRERDSSAMSVFVKDCPIYFEGAHLAKE
jgi:hypothetical protein